MPKVFYGEGRYLARVTNQAMGQTSKDNPQFILRVLVLAKLDGAGNEHEVMQYERTIYRVITDKTVEYFVQDLDTLGFTGLSFKFLDPATPNYHNFAGTEFTAFCKHEQNDNGEIHEKWGIARSSQEITTRPLESSKIRQLDNLYGKHLKALKRDFVPARAAATAPAPRPVPSPDDFISDDDVAF